MQFALNLKKLMQENGVSNYRLAKAIGCSQSTVKNWLNGVVPSAERAQQVAAFFGVTVGTLLGETEKPAITEDDELQEYLEELKNRPEMKMLFSLAKGATKEDVEKAVKIVETLLGK